MRRRSPTLSTGYVQGKGLRNLEKSKRYSLKGKRFLNVFLPVGFYLLILELLTLIVCIVVFAPLSQIASHAFILTIALTALLLLLIPLILSLISGYQGDKAVYKERLAQEKQTGRPVRCPGTGNRPSLPEAVSPAAKNIDTVSLSWRLLDFWTCTFSYQERSGSFDRPAIEEAIFGVDGCRRFLLYPSADVLGQLLRNILGTTGLS